MLIFLLLLRLFVSCLNKAVPRSMSRSIYPLFSSRTFMVASLTFKSLIHFKSIFVSGGRQGPCSGVYFVCVFFENFQIVFSISVKNTIGVFVGIVLNL